MKTLHVIDTYSGISGFLPAMWPYYESAGLPILGVERTNSKTAWPNNRVESIAVGEDVFQSWANHKSTTLLPKRFMDIIDTVCTIDRFSQFDSFVISEWDVAWFKPFVFPIGTQICLRKTGGKSRFFPAFKATNFFHLPWCLTKDIGRIIVDEGRLMLKEGDTELGSPDFFIGRLLDRLHFGWSEIPGYSFNKLDSDRRIQEARESIKNGGLFVHGIQNHEQLRKLVS